MILGESRDERITMCKGGLNWHNRQESWETV